MPSALLLCCMPLPSIVALLMAEQAQRRQRNLHVQEFIVLLDTGRGVAVR